jgi:hypothetical protein
MTWAEEYVLSDALRDALDDPLGNGCSMGRQGLIFSTNRAEIKPADSGRLGTLPDWFERQEGNTYYHFVFKVSKIGVVRHFPEELWLFQECEEEIDL